jgi:hypothetical protein
MGEDWYVEKRTLVPGDFKNLLIRFGSAVTGNDKS